MDDMQIKEVRIYSAVSKITKPIADATHDISKIAFYVLEVDIFFLSTIRRTQLKGR